MSVILQRTAAKASSAVAQAGWPGGGRLTAQNPGLAADWRGLDAEAESS